MGVRQLRAPASRSSASRASPRDPFEKIADAAQVHALHRPGADGRAAHPVGQGRRLRQRCAPHAEDLGVRARHDQLQHCSRTTTTSSARSTHADARVRRKAIDHHLECIDIMDADRLADLKIWLADGTNYPGQDDMRARQDRLAESLARDLRRARRRPAAGAGVQVLRAGVLPHGRPGLGHLATRTCRALGERAVVCLDTGHHAPGTNIEFIVTQLLRLGKLGSFDFNSRFYADDDLIVGAADPFQLFRIMLEVVRGGGSGDRQRRRVHARPVPQHRGQDPRPDPLGAQRPGDDGPGAARRPRRARRGPAAGDVLAANEVLMDAFYTDVRPTSPPGASRAGCPPTRWRPTRPRGYQEQIDAERVGGTQAGWGA